MDFNDYRLFLMPDMLPSAPPIVLDRSPSTKRSHPSDLNLTEDEPDTGDSDWSHVNLTESGEVEAESLSPALSPTAVGDRMAHSLDLGHGSFDLLENQHEVDNYSFPWQSRSRTLEDSPRNCASTNNSDHRPSVQRKTSTGSSDSDKIKYKLMSAWNNMKFGEYGYYG